MLKRDLHINIHHNIIHNNQMKQPKHPSKDEWIKKLWCSDFPGGPVLCNPNVGGPGEISVQGQIFVIQSLTHVQLFATSWTAASQASLSFTVSQSLLKFTSIESVMLWSHIPQLSPWVATKETHTPQRRTYMQQRRPNTVKINSFKKDTVIYAYTHTYIHKL